MTTTQIDRPVVTEITPPAFEFADELFAVAPDGSLMVWRGGDVCRFGRDGVEVFCRAVSGFEPFGDVGTRFVSWSPGSGEIAFQAGESLAFSQVVVLDVVTGETRLVGGREQGLAATSPFWVDGVLHWLAYQLGVEGGALVAMGAVLDDQFAVSTGNAAALPQFASVGDEVFSLVLGRDGVVVSRHEPWPQRDGTPIGSAGSTTIGFVASPDGQALVIGGAPVGGSGVTWTLLTAAGLVSLPFDGVAAAAAPGGLRAIGVRSDAPDVLVIVDVATMREVTTVPLGVQVDQVFWSSPDTVTVTSRGLVYDVRVP